ncbi:MAG TPA: hemerythrin domain-containing protein [Kofleriaceae bacterium]
MTYQPTRALAELSAQHDVLRAMMDRCEELLGQDAGRGARTQLSREVTRLRLAFEAHNVFEERLLRPLLEARDGFAAARIDRMIGDHVDEHHALQQRLNSKDTGDLRDVIETLRAHLDAEERYLLTPKVLRDDVVTVQGTR